MCPPTLLWLLAPADAKSWRRPWVNLVKWGISIDGMPMVVGDSFFGRLRAMQQYGCNKFMSLVLPLSLWHNRGHQTTPFSKQSITRLQTTGKKLSEKRSKTNKGGFSLPWSPHQDHDDQKRVPTLIQPAQQVRLTAFSQVKALREKQNF